MKKLIQKVFGHKIEASQPKTRQETLKGDMLEITSLVADIEIQPGLRDNEITVEVTGDAVLVDSLDIAAHDSIISIAGSSAKGMMVAQNISFGLNTGQPTVIIKNNKNSIISGNYFGTIISTDDSAERLSLRIKAPTYTEINIRETMGDITIGNLQSDMELDLFGQSSAHIATNVRDFKLSCAGQCRVTVREITGNAKLKLSGDSTVKLERGYVKTLWAHASGTSKIDACLTAESADLEAFGTSVICVKEVRGRCRERVSGMSQIATG